MFLSLTSYMHLLHFPGFVGLCKNTYEISSIEIPVKDSKFGDYFLFFPYLGLMGHLCCDLEVDVNGEEVFVVDKNIICPYSSRFYKLFGKSKGAHLKVFFNDFPGGARSFELMARFCYNSGKIDITPSNICLLHCAADFMEMDRTVSSVHNLIQQTEKSFGEIGYWTWPDLLFALKQCQDVLKLETSSGVLRKCVDSLVGRLAVASEASPCPSSSSHDSSSVRFSCDTKSTESLKNSMTRVTWWFEDLTILNLSLVEMAIKSMVCRKLDHQITSRFLLFYHKTKFVSATPEEKLRITTKVIDLLYLLDWSSVPLKSLFGILRIASTIKIEKSCRNKLECMIGSQLDQATLDNLLIPSPNWTSCLYDVNAVVRFLRSFFQGEQPQVSSVRWKKISSLMDLYLAEVAPDPFLRPSKFLTLATAVPDSARDSYDGVYHAIALYLEVHSGLSEEEKLKLSSAMNYKKLSTEACAHLAQNCRFPPKSLNQALKSQQLKLKELIQGTNQLNPLVEPSCSLADTELIKPDQEREIVLYARKLNISRDDEKLKAMQWRVMELEKVCRTMQKQMAKIMKASSVTTHSTSRSLPRMCS